MKKALLQLHAAVFLWGFTGVLGRAISLSSTMLVWWRLLITTVTLIGIFAISKSNKRLSVRRALPIAGIGTILALHWVCFYGSIKLANVTIALTCLSTTALLAALIEPLIIRRKFDPFEVVLGLFAVAGIVIIYNTHLQFSIGIAVGLAAAVFTVLASVLNKRVVDDYDPQQMALYQLGGGFVGLTALMPLFQFLFPEPWVLPNKYDWLWLVILSWLCTVLTYFLYIRALRKVSAFTVNLALTLEPIYGIALAFFFYNEDKEVSRWFYLGFALIAAAVVLHTFRLLWLKKTVVDEQLNP